MIVVIGAFQNNIVGIAILRYQNDNDGNSFFKKCSKFTTMFLDVGKLEHFL